MENKAKMDNLIDWLKDAHAMEMQAVQLLEQREKRLTSYPALKGRVGEHLEQSRRQAERIEGVLESLGTNPSTLKAGVARAGAFVGGLTQAAASDEVVKGVLHDYAFENFEIASYRSLVAAAEDVGATEVKRVCEENLGEEQAMAGWLLEHVPEVTQAFLHAGAGR